MLSTLRTFLKKGVITEQYSLSTVTGELGFASKRARGHVLPYLKNRLIWYYASKLNWVSRFPTHLDIEISSLCQLNCPMCYTTTDYYKKRVKKGLLDYDLYKRIINECRRYPIYSIRFSWRGEPLLHPRVIDMLRYAKKAGIKEVSFLTNGGKLDRDLIDALIINGLDWITVSFDGLYGVYEYYRKPLKFEDTVAKLKQLQRRKKELGIAKPVLKVQTVWDAIESDPDGYFQFMSEIADEVAFNPVKDKHYYKEFSLENFKKDYVCPRLWQRMYISSSGNMGFCLSDVYEDMVIGNVRDMGVHEAWNSEAFRKIRQRHRDHARFDYLICRRCQAGLKRQKTVVGIQDRLVEATKYEFS